MKIIDIHAHTTNNDLWDLHVKTATIEDLEKEARTHGINKIILNATYFPFKKGGLPNRVLLDRIKDKQLFSMFASLDIMNNFTNGLIELREVAKEKSVLGIKLYPGYQDFSPSDRKVFPIYELAEEHNLPVTYHAGELHHCCPKDDRMKKNYRCKGRCRIDELGHLSRPKEMREAIKTFPNVKFILSHLANPYFEELREVMQKYTNVYTDISGQLVSGSEEDNQKYREEIKEEVKKFLKIENGIERVMFATDFPIQSYAYSIDLIESLGLTREAKEKIFYRNALKVLNLKEA